MLSKECPGILTCFCSRKVSRGAIIFSSKQAPRQLNFHLQRSAAAVSYYWSRWSKSVFFFWCANLTHYCTFIDGCFNFVVELMDIHFCYIARLSLNKMSTVIGDSWSRASDQTQMYLDWDTIAQLLPARHLCFFVFAIWRSKYITKHLMYGPSGN